MCTEKSKTEKISSSFIELMDTLDVALYEIHFEAPRKKKARFHLEHFEAFLYSHASQSMQRLVKGSGKAVHLAAMHPHDAPLALGQLTHALDAATPYALSYRIKKGATEKRIVDRGVGIYNKTGEMTGLKGMVEVKRQEFLPSRQHQTNPSLRLGEMVGKSPAMQKIFKRIQNIQESDATVLITGESGTGKEMVARTIHQHSLRHDGPFVVVNCAAVPEPLFESEFFGHLSGSFTGANETKEGYFDLAHRGTLFLDEVGEIPPAMQVKLLRVLDGEGFSAVGSRRTHHANVRLLAATNRNLDGMLQAGSLRKDFYYRLHVIPIHIPPLRNRKEDIAPLIQEITSHFPQGDRLFSKAMAYHQKLLDHNWPGNVRELKNALQRMVDLDELLLENSFDQKAEKPANKEPEAKEKPVALKVSMTKAEKRFIFEALTSCKWRRDQTAKRLGISRKTLFLKMKSHQLNS